MGMAKVGKPTPAKANAGAVMNPVMDKPIRSDILSVVTITPIHSETSIISQIATKVASHESMLA